MIHAGCNMIYCNSCGEENPEEAAFCWKCGRPLYKHPKGSEEGISCRTNEDIISESREEIVHHETVENPSSTFAFRYVNPQTEVKVADEDEDKDKEREEEEARRLLEKKRRLKAESDKYRIPMIICGFVTGLITIALLCTITQDYTLHGLIPKTESYTFIELAMNGWNNYLTLGVVLMIVFSLLSFVYYGFSLGSVLSLFLVYPMSIRFEDISIGYLTYDIEMVVDEGIAFGSITPWIFFVGIFVPIILAEYFCWKYNKQFDRDVSTLETIKHLWSGN